MKKILFAALFAPAMALAQTYPSPTFNSLTLQNPLTTANGGTGATTSTGTGSAVLSNSPTLTTPALGTPSSITLTNGTGLPISTGVSGLGTGVAAGLANAVTGSGGAVLATSPSIANPTITGTFAATGLVTPADLASQAANTMLANAAGVSASPTAIAMPSCSTSSSALQWAAGAGPACNTSINAATLGGATFDAPGPIGSSTPNTYAFTTGTQTEAVETVNFSPNQSVTMFPGQATDYSDHTLTHTNSGSHSGTSNSAFSIANAVAGSGANGPTNADYGLYLSNVKNNFLTSSTLGEIDGLSIVTRQGQDDTDGILVNAGGVAGFMGILEGVTSQFQATTGTVLNQMDVQLGSIETGLTGTAGSEGFVATATVGTLGTGLLIQSSGTAGWTNAIQVGANGGGATTFTVTPAGLVTANGGISGVTSGTGGATGTVGENQSTSTTGTSMASGTSVNCASKSLAAGDWLVWGNVQFSPAGSTTVSSLYAGVSTTSATLPSPSQYTNFNAGFTTGQAQVLPTTPAIENLSSTTTVYLVGNSTFGTSTMTCNGYIYAIRYH